MVDDWSTVPIGGRPRDDGSMLGIDPRSVDGELPDTIGELIVTRGAGQ